MNELFLKNCKDPQGLFPCGSQAVEKPRRRLMRQSSGGVCAGGKKPTARSIKQDFETFFKSFKIRTAWRKDFFDTLRPAGVISLRVFLRRLWSDLGADNVSGWMLVRGFDGCGMWNGYQLPYTP